jgi:cytochrome bd-type quinol oxidase subunit 1
MGIVTTIFSPLMLALSAWYTSKFGRFSPWDVRLGTIVEEVKPLRITRIILSLIVIAIAMNETAKLLEPWLESMRMYLEQM